MTEQKTFKRSIRARMEKTGESYAAARRELLAKAEREANGATVESYETPVAEETIVERTGKRSGEWFAILDAWGGTERTHKEIAGQLTEVHDIEGWWAQSLTVMYEQARGMRAKGQRANGLFEATASKTVAVPVEELFDAFCDEGRRRAWLPDGGLSERTQRPPKGARFDWEDGTTRVIVTFDRKGDGGDKSVVALAHERIPDAESLEELKLFWRERLGVLKQELEG